MCLHNHSIYSCGHVKISDEPCLCLPDGLTALQCLNPKGRVTQHTHPCTRCLWALPERNLQQSQWELQRAHQQRAHQQHQQAHQQLQQVQQRQHQQQQQQQLQEAALDPALAQLDRQQRLQTRNTQHQEPPVPLRPQMGAVPTQLARPFTPRNPHTHHPQPMGRPAQARLLVRDTEPASPLVVGTSSSHSTPMPSPLPQEQSGQTESAVQPQASTGQSEVWSFDMEALMRRSLVMPETAEADVDE